MAHESQRRRTFAIISHPDAGKTTLTEKLLLYGGAIHAAGALTGLGLRVIESDANFLLFGQFADAKATWQAYLDAGVLVRDMGIPGYLRTTIGTDAENDVLIKVSATLKESE